jgi:alpha-amylase/alpha-mannosidase (GH57 family)
VATDGETFGHHKYGTEKCIAYAVTQDFPHRGWIVTNYAYYLSINPPTWEVELKPVTAWSCSHGVDRWQDDCGCGGGGEWHQKWRKPLRNALDWLRDQLIEIYYDQASKLFLDPWEARDQYIEIILDRSREKIEEFFRLHQSHNLTSEEKVDALRLLEMQRHALLMYTSCGWFFEEISRPEGVQILRYASRALDLAAELTGIQLEKEFLSHLCLAPSNLKKYQDGALIYQKMVLSSKIGFKQVGVHYAISSLFTNPSNDQAIYYYNTQQIDYKKRQIGSLTLAVGQVNLFSEITWESSHFIFAVLHFGGWDFHCCIQPFTGRGEYGKIKDFLFETMNQGSVVKMILAMSQLFGEEFFNLEHLFPQERHRIMQKLANKTKKHLDQLYTQVYRDNYGIIVAFQRNELPVPQELQVAAQVALSHRFVKSIEALEGCENDLENFSIHLNDLIAIASEVNHLQCKLNLPEEKKSIEKLILRKLKHILAKNDSHTLEIESQQLLQMIELGEKLHLNLCLDPAQELYFYCLRYQINPSYFNNDNSHSLNMFNSSRSFLQLGKKLQVAIPS